MNASPMESTPRLEDGAEPHRNWTIVLAGLGVFMTALDNMVVTTALPAMRTSLHAGLDGLEWTVNAYVLAFGCLLLTGSALGDRFGRRRMFGIGIGLFTAASAGAALSPSVGVLVVARVVQGAGAAIVFPLTLTLISEAFPPEKRGAAIGMWGAVAGIAAGFGPLIGGAIVNGIDWHWIFWVNVPVGVALVAFAPRLLRESYGPRPQLDVQGLLLASVGSLGVTWALVRANTIGWGSGEVLATLIGGCALIGGFLGWERRAPSPMVPLELFRRPGFASANAASFFMYAGVFGALVFMSQWFQFAQGHSPLVAGLMLLPWTATPGLVSPFAGKFADRLGNRPFMAAGLGLQAIGLGWIAAVATAHLGYLQVGLALTLAGIGIGMVFPTVANAALASAPPEEAGIASGTNGTCRELGGVLGIALFAAVFSRPGVYSSHHIFVEGFRAGMTLAVALSVLGVLAAAASPGRQTPSELSTADDIPGPALERA